MNKESLSSSRLFEILAGSAILIGLAIVSFYNYPLFHSLAEIFSIVVAWMAFLLVWNSRHFIDNGYLALLGVAFLFIGFVDVLHTLAYAGVNLFPGTTSNLPTQLWLAARYIQSLTFLVGPFLVHRKLNLTWAAVPYFALVAVLLLSIFEWNLFPASYIEGVGLTPFKIASEYVICAILLLALVLLVRKREAFDPNVLQLLAFSISASVASELAFTSYVQVIDRANMIGHLFKIVAFYLIYKAIVQTGIVKPYNLVFRELKESEVALRAVIADLAREIEVRRQAQAKVDGLNEALQKHAVELEMANNELEAFAYTVSHDLRAPLRSIEGFSRLVLEDYEGQVPPGARQFLQLIHENAKETDTLVAGLLALSRTSSQALRKQTVKPGEIVRQVIGELADAQAGRCVEFSVGEMPDCQADPLLLKQVWVNLLSNALKFTRKRPVARIEVGCGQFDGESAFFIRDNGAGFDMHRAEKLFGVFQRFHRQEDYEGTGVGLAIVARIIRRHGGRIWAQAELDQGATFYFTL